MIVIVIVIVIGTVIVTVIVRDKGTATVIPTWVGDGKVLCPVEIRQEKLYKATIGMLIPTLRVLHSAGGYIPRLYLYSYHCASAFTISAAVQSPISFIIASTIAFTINDYCDCYHH